MNAFSDLKLRAALLATIKEWSDNRGDSVHIMVDVLVVPELKRNVTGKVFERDVCVLNVDWNACPHYTTYEDRVVIDVRFNTVPSTLVMPYNAILGIGSRDNKCIGNGVTWFHFWEPQAPEEVKVPEPTIKKPTGLKVVK